MPTNQSVQSANEDSLSQACVYTTDTSTGNKLREFLTSFGCDVILNSTPVSTPDYFIACGDSNFVKDIYSKPRKYAVRSLAIVWDVNALTIQTIQTHADKIIVVKSPPFSDDSIRQIFSFFFTPGDAIHYLAKPVENEFVDDFVEKPEHVELKEIMEKPVPNQLPVSRAPLRQKTQLVHALDDVDRQRIRDTMKEVFGDTVKPKNVERKISRRRTTIGWGKIISFFIIICIAPVVWYVISLSISLGTLMLSSIQLSEGNIPVSKQAVTVASYWTKQSRATLTLFQIPLMAVGKGNLLRRQERVLSFLGDSEDALSSTHIVIEKGKEFSKTLAAQLTGATGATLSPATLIASLGIQLPYIHDRLGLASAELGFLIKEKAFPFSLPFVESKTGTLLTILETSRKNIGVIESLLTVYKEAGGFLERKKYLVLLQNSMELRPTGGFIGSLAEVSVHNGLIEELTIHDVYTVDGQLKGHVDPPLPIRELLGQEHWYLRDSNWDPDFTVSGNTAAWFYEKETNTVVDGVFAISTPFLTELLKVTGPIQLPDYSDSITADNFFGKSLYYVQNNFFAGSTQKKDFLGSLTQAIVTKITEQKSINTVSLLRAIENALDRHDIQMTFKNPELTHLVSEYGWAGTNVLERSCNVAGSQVCVGDFLQVVDANLSVNKVNAFISKKQTTEVELDDAGKAQVTTSLIYENTSQLKGTEGGGVYKNFVRLFVPVDAQLIDANLDGQPIPVRVVTPKKIPQPPYIDSMKQTVLSNGRSVSEIGVAFEVPQSKTVRLTVKYSYTYKTPKENENIVYEFLQPKQPGVSKTTLTTRIRFPGNWKLSPQHSPDKQDLLANQTQLEYNSLQPRDEIIRVFITKP